MTRTLYSALATLAEPALGLLLARRRASGKEDPARLGERKGIAGRPRPSGRLLWVHGASLGEARSILPVVARLRAGRPDLNVLVTTGSRSSADMLAAQLDGTYAFHQFVPLDVPRWIARFLDHWRPDAVLWLESELWPNLLGEVAQRKIPAALVNARLTARSAARWAKAKAVFAPPFEAFSAALAQSEADAGRLRALGMARVAAIGNLKHDAPVLAVDEAAFASFQLSLGGRARWLAAQIHPVELAAILDARAMLKAQGNSALLVLVPRHAERGAEMADAARTKGLSVSRRAAGEAPGDGDVHVADTMGELGLFYRAAPIAFVGGSLEPHGGHNPLEPARLGAAIAFGPSMENFAELAADLLEAGAATRVADAASLASWAAGRLADPALVAKEGEAARTFAARGEGTVERVVAALGPVLAGLGPEAVTHARP
ncbi:MAG: 3-deoxy-D-manno-octulosonic acid transferase [Proteobacteria bacterium]|nr:3-deoxy-D-manno-octulosonic acid transferase [Pseudomonadota bacterium]